MTEETNLKKRGRKPGTQLPKAPQTMPLILATKKHLVSKELKMDGETAALINSYSAWAAKKGDISKDEATLLLLAKAIPLFVKRDTLYQKEVVGGNAPTEE